MDSALDQTEREDLMRYIMNMTTATKSRSYDDNGEFHLRDVYGMAQIFEMYYRGNKREVPEVKVKNFLLYMMLSLDENAWGVLVEATDILEPLLDEMNHGFKRQLAVFIPVMEGDKIVSVRQVYTPPTV